MDRSMRIVGLRLNEAHFAINQQYKSEKNKPVDLKYSLEVAYKQADRVLRVLLTVSSNYENQPFRFSVAWEGSFAFEEMPPTESLDRVAHVNCASIIFPYARESIADLTRRSGATPLNLPPFNFVAMYEGKQKVGNGGASQKARKKAAEPSKAGEPKT
jgi:preprotein translocase subunit SecB